MSRVLVVLLMAVLAIGVVGQAQTPVTPRAADGVLLFDNETGAKVLRLGVLFDGPITVCKEDIIAFGGEATTRLDMGDRTAWIDAEVLPGGTLQVTYSGNAKVHSAYWVATAEEKNKVVCRWLIESVWNAGDLEAIPDFIAPEFMFHGIAMVGDIPGIEGYTMFVGGSRMGFPDAAFTIYDVFAQDDLVTLRVERNGTHTGDLMGIPPTGASVSERAIAIYRISDGKIVEGWMEYDALGLLVQLGLAPPMGPPLFSWDASSNVTGDPGDVEENRVTSSRLNEAWNTGDLALLDELLSPDFIYHGASATLDLEGYKAYMSAFLAAFPDAQFTLVNTIVEADRAGGHLAGAGTSQGAFMGIPPTGQQIAFKGMSLHRLADGRIVEIWELFDIYGMLVQLGVIPPPGG